MVARGYWMVGTVMVLGLGGCGGMQQVQHATLLNNVSTPSFSSFSFSKFSLSSFSSWSFPGRGEKEKTTARDLPVIIPQDQGEVQTGVASWYGPRFHGKRTANGEVYNQHALTAAHPTLPMGTRAVVTNIDTGESVEVRINDRGPYKYGRVIDLSYEAARRIGMWATGTAPVR